MFVGFIWITSSWVSSMEERIKVLEKTQLVVERADLSGLQKDIININKGI